MVTGVLVLFGLSTTAVSGMVDYGSRAPPDRDT
jgi:hypothetical protein